MRDDLLVQGRESVADWIETTAFVRTKATWAVDTIATLAAEELGLEAAAVHGGLLAMQRRARQLNSAYPFVVSSLAVKRLAHARQSPYIAMLFLTPGAPARQLVHRSSTEVMEVAFERIVERAFKSFWGPQSKAIRFGSPSDMGRPPEFDLAIAWLAKETGLPEGHGYRQPRRKDGGVDVVAWRPFPDGKPGIPLVLVQCTLQSELVSKSADIDTRLWASWLRLDVDPMTALAVPQVVTSGEQWNEITLRSLLLDRIRLASLSDPDGVPDEMGGWIVETSNELRERLWGAEE